MIALVAWSAWGQELQPGDVVFHRSHSSQAAMIAAATGSEWTHTGLVSAGDDGELVVIEAVEPVRIVPLDEWLARGDGGRWAAARPPAGTDLAVVDAAARSYVGLHYDSAFSWDDRRIYCSELVRKAFGAAGVDAGTLQPVSSFDIASPVVLAALWRRGIPLDRRVVSPASLLADPDFERIH